LAIFKYKRPNAFPSLPDFSPATAQRYEIIGTTQMKSIQIDSTTSKYKQKQPKTSYKQAKTTLYLYQYL
jgi:hypothetical protein